MHLRSYPVTIGVVVKGKVSKGEGNQHYWHLIS